MKTLRLLTILVTALYCTPGCFSQLVVNAGSDTAFCNYNWEQASIGGDPTATGGTPPYTYTWSAQYEYAGHIFAASFLLADTTVANPAFKSPIIDSATFYLTVTDSNQNTAIDSVTVRFSSFNICLGECRTEIALGDSVQLSPCCISGGIPPYQYSWTPVESLSDPASEAPWAKPQVSTTYELVLTDSIGCQISNYSTVIVDTFGQYFAPLGAIWHYGKRENPHGGPETGYLLVKSVMKMEINNYHVMVLAKIYYASDGTIHDRGYEYVYTEGKKVYYIKDQRSFLLYDFTAETGDTLEFREPYYSAHNSDTTFTMVVDSTDFFSVDGTELKRIYLRDISLKWDLYSTHIERIGNLPYLFPQMGLDCDAGCFYPLRCYSDHSIHFKNVSYDCDRLVSGIKEHDLTGNIKIYPNPASNVVNFFFNDPDYANSVLQLFRVDGKMVKEVVVCDHIITIDLTEFKQGVYLYNWIMPDNNIEVGKFVVE